MDPLFLKPEEYKELDELMTYLLDDLWGTDDKDLAREGIIKYTELWHKKQLAAAKRIEDKTKPHCPICDSYIRPFGTSFICNGCNAIFSTTKKK